MGERVCFGALTQWTRLSLDQALAALCSGGHNNRRRGGSIIRLVGAVLAEQHDEWIEGRRYLGLDVLTRAVPPWTPPANPTTSKHQQPQP